MEVSCLTRRISWESSKMPIVLVFGRNSPAMEGSRAMTVGWINGKCATRLGVFPLQKSNRRDWRPVGIREGS